MKEVIEAIKNNLTTDLLAKTWLSRNAVQNMAGHCYHASCVLQNYYPELELHRAVDDEGEYHWFCRSENDIIDITVEQYTERGLVPPHSKGKRTARLGWGYPKKVEKLHERVERELSGNKTTLEVFYER